MLLDDEKEITQDQQEEVTNAAEETTEVAATVAEETSENVEVIAEAATETAEEIVEEAVTADDEDEPVVVKKAEEPIKEEDDEEIELLVSETLLAAGGAHDDFNWNMDKRGALIYSQSEHAELLSKYDATITNIEENSVIRGRVSAISGGDVVLDINYKSDGLVPMNEFRDTPDLKAGDEVEIYVESPEGKQGNLGLSRKKAKILRAW